MGARFLKQVARVTPSQLDEELSKVILRDVHNLVQRLKSKARGSYTVEMRLEAVLRKFCGNQDYTASVFTDDSKKNQIITLQTRQMRRFFEDFPEVVMLDSTNSQAR
ncbi:Hypothetical protein PHPALM_11443 [Phytophthora palmivora]|uniref:ZSWIM1/3 RNaseH-like domain-containing protein n=1 Tax=Phytophthora palmivora TaxID=4796 RepID=A0A2P4Y277_9STRA|nr:Hypothetical protein PHPALM_11443 [Phytophthora palmivora]